MPEKLIKPIIYEKKRGVSWLILNRPEFLNAVTTEMGNAALETIDRCLEDDDTRVIAITGRGNALSAGADVTEIVGDPDPIKRIGILATIAHKVIAAIRQSKKPTIAAINHQAAGYGMALALACDIRVATKKVRLRYAYSTIGLTGDGGINWSLPRMIGISRALEVALLCEDLHGEELQRLGVINKLFDEETFIDDTQALAERVAALDPRVSQAIKRMMYSSSGTDLLTHLETEHAYLTEAASRPEFIELVRVIMEQFQLKKEAKEKE
jgi:2-(1,2-epoxy-1,2-dihydrophenyl)acetyl-CoA isomerase